MIFNRMPLSRLALAVAAAVGTTDVALAQQNIIEEVVVTARKRSESLQRVPMAVSAFNAEQLLDAQIDNITDLERMTPNITVTDTGGLVAGAVSVFIRGIGNDAGFDQGVGIYIDDVYLNRTTGALLDVYDVERIEVLKGPQGNLYGRNTIGGAIKYVSREATDEWEGDVEVRAGEFDLLQLRANAAGPLIEDTLYGTFGAMYRTRDGIQTNTFDGGEYWDADIGALRGALRWDVNDSFRIKLSGDYSIDESSPRLPNRIAVDPATLAQIDFVTTGANQFLGPGLGLFATPNDTSLPTDIDTVSTEFVDGYSQFEIETATVALTATWDISERWTVKSVTAQRNVDNVQVFDFDGSEQQFITTVNYRSSEDFSQEFQFNYGGESVQAVFGVYYLDGVQESPSDQFQYPRLRAILTEEQVTTQDDRNLESYSAYGNIDWDINEQWQLSLGGRYTRDEKVETIRADVTEGRFALAGLQGFPPNAIVAVAPGQEAAASQSPGFAFWASQFIPPAFNTEFTEVQLREDSDADDAWSEFTPSARLTYFMDEDLMFYGGYSTGFKTGGFQRTGGVATAYDPETVATYTLGFKGTFADGSLRFNTEFFLNDYTDKQLSTIVLNEGSLDEFVGNVGELETSGFEMELVWLPPVQGLYFAANLGYLDVDIKAYPSGDTDLADTTAIGFAPEWTAQARVAYEFDISDLGSLTLGADVAYRDESFTNSPIDLTSDLETSQVQEAHEIFNASAVFITPDQRWRVAVEGKNLADERVLTNSFVVGPFVTGAYNMPRTWAVSLGYRF